MHMAKWYHIGFARAEGLEFKTVRVNHFRVRLPNETTWDCSHSCAALEASSVANALALALKKFKTMPSYKIISEIGPDHKKHFIVEALISGKRYGIGSGYNKKSAEQASAKEALSALEGAG